MIKTKLANIGKIAKPYAKTHLILSPNMTIPKEVSLSTTFHYMTYLQL